MKPKNLFLTLMAMLLLVSAAAQSRKQVRQYYYWINQAELAICDGDYAKANDCYDRAFQKMPPLYRDLWAVFQLNGIYTHDAQKMLDYAHLKLQANDIEVALSYLNYEETDSMLFKALTLMEDTTIRLTSSDIEQLLETIISRDQSFYHRASLTPYEDSLDNVNYLAIKKLYKDHPHLDIFTAGIYFESYLTTPALHFVQKGDLRLQKILRNATLRGAFSATNYMEIQEWNEPRNTGRDKGRDTYGVGKDYFFYVGNNIDILFRIIPQDIDKINKNRKKLGLSETYEDYCKKVIWQFENSTINFFGITHIWYSGDDEEDILRLKQEIDAEHAAGDFHRMYYEKGSKVSE